MVWYTRICDMTLRTDEHRFFALSSKIVVLLPCRFLSNPGIGKSVVVVVPDHVLCFSFGDDYGLPTFIRRRPYW